MARDCYETTIALPDATDGYAMKPLANVKVSVVTRGATDLVAGLVDIFPADTGLTEGPDPKTGASGTNPFTTSASGAVRFWAEGPAELDIVFEDTITPARVTDRVGWNSVPAKAGSLSTSMLALDGGPTTGIKQGHLSAEVVMQQTPIGGVMEWWRPQQSVPLPAGYEVADGRSVAHEFPGVAGLVTLPNLQNCFILGATVAKNDGEGAGSDNLPGSGPGIRGTGGSNAPKNLAHGHAVPLPDHYHNFTLPDHYHNAGGLYTGNHSHGVSVAGNTGNANRDAGTRAWGGSGEGVAYTAHQHYVASSGGTDVAGNIGVYGSTAYVSQTHALPTTNTTWSSSASATFPGTAATSTTTWTATGTGSFPTEFRPYFVGLLRLIKVRRTA